MKEITKEQIKAINAIFEFTGETFQTAASKAGINTIPDHISDISYEDAAKLMKLYNIRIPE